MYIVVFTSFIALLLTFLEYKKIMPNGMRWGFVLVTFLGCIHYDYGNDYMAYMNDYKIDTKYSFDLIGVVTDEYIKEPGWVLLSYLFKPIGGFFMMVAALNIFQNVIVYKTIKKYVEKSWWPMAVFIYLFSTCLYLLNFSMMRQGLVVCVFLWSWQWIVEKKWVKTVLVLLICVNIHKSAFFLLPFAFLGFIPMKNGKFLVLSIIVVFASLWMMSSLMSDILLSLMVIEEVADYAMKYGDSTEVETFGMGYVFGLIPFFLALRYLFFDKSEDGQGRKPLVALSVAPFLIDPFSSVIPLISRVSYYFIAYQILAFPVIYKYVNHYLLRYIFLFIYVLLILYTYLSFFSSPVWIGRYTVFKTIFSQIF